MTLHNIYNVLDMNNVEMIYSLREDPQVICKFYAILYQGLLRPYQREGCTVTSLLAILRDNCTWLLCAAYRHSFKKSCSFVV